MTAALFTTCCEAHGNVGTSPDRINPVLSHPAVRSTELRARLQPGMFDVISPGASPVGSTTLAPSKPTQRSLRRSASPTRSHRDRRSAVCDNVLDAIGQTPTVRLDRIAARRDLEVFAKLEFCNPAGSMKDRPSRAMLEEAISDGRLRPGMTVVESSSGNMGIGLAQACAYHGYRFVCVVDPRTQPTNLQVMRAYGAVIDLVEQPDPASGDFLTARINRVREYVAGGGVFWPNQYANTDNPGAHAAGTARELHEAAGDLDLLLIATSTTGTLGGCLQYFSQASPETRVAAVDASGSVLFGGEAGSRRISGLGAGKIPELATETRPDAVYRVSDLDCVVGCRKLVRAEAILAGGSSGGLVQTLGRLEHTLPLGHRIGMIFADGGARYLETVYNDQWVEDATGCSADALAQLTEQRS